MENKERTMEFNDYQKLAIRTCAPADKAIGRMTIKQLSLLEDIVEDLSMDGAALDRVKRAVFYGKSAEEDVTPLPHPEERMSEHTADAVHAAIGLLTESIELGEAIILKATHNEPIDEKNAFEEIGDIMWYLAVLTKALGIDMNQVMKANIDKLAARYGDKFDDYKAVNRDLQAETKALENVRTKDA